MINPNNNPSSAAVRVAMIALLCLATFIMAVSCSPVAAQANSVKTPASMCKELARTWTMRSSVFSDAIIESVTQRQEMLYCIVRVTENKMHYSKPVNIKFTYNVNTGGFIAKRWGY